MWLSPNIRVKFGAYFDKDPDEQKSVVALVQAALGKGPGLVGAPALITRRQALEVIAPIMGIENVDAAMEALDAEAAEDAAAATEKLKTQQAAMVPKTPAVESAPPAIDDKKPKTAPESAPPAALPKK